RDVGKISSIVRKSRECIPSEAYDADPISVIERSFTLSEDVTLNFGNDPQQPLQERKLIVYTIMNSQWERGYHRSVVQGTLGNLGCKMHSVEYPSFAAFQQILTQTASFRQQLHQGDFSSLQPKPRPFVPGLFTAENVKKMEAEVAAGDYKQVKKLFDDMREKEDHPVWGSRPEVLVGLADCMIRASLEGGREQRRDWNKLIQEFDLSRVIRCLKNDEVYAHATGREGLQLQCSNGVVHCNEWLFQLTHERYREQIAKEKTVSFTDYEKETIEAFKTHLYTMKYPYFQDFEIEPRLFMLVELIELNNLLEKGTQRSSNYADQKLLGVFNDTLKKCGPIEEGEWDRVIGRILLLQERNETLGKQLFNRIQECVGPLDHYRASIRRPVRASVALSTQPRSFVNPSRLRQIKRAVQKGNYTHLRALVTTLAAL
ncbi:MAG TPA: hypothetical protein VN457_00705, partial [Chlamydiales bacterium]|nr:hypothetical protein [Chlamydiales bacterium]